MGVNNLAGAGVSAYQTQVVQPAATDSKVMEQATDAATTEAATVKMPAVAKPQEKQKEKQRQVGDDRYMDDQEDVSQEKIRKALESINKQLSHTECQYGFHDKTNRVTIKIVDKDTEKVIKEFPPEETLEMIAKAWELAGILVDEKL